jgi:hypothetical protein
MRIKACNDDEELDALGYFVWPICFCFWAKLASVVVAYALVLKYVYTLL